MKKGSEKFVLLILFSFVLVILLTGFVSAGWWGDLWTKITGRVTQEINNNWCKYYDVNHDRKVDNIDINLVLAGRSPILKSCNITNHFCNWNDVNHDGKCDSIDISLVRVNYGASGCYGCNDSCSVYGQKRCNGNIAQTCSDYNSDYCWEYNNTACNANERCENGQCIKNECFIEKYPEFNSIINTYCPVSEPNISKPNCDYGEIVRGICLMGTNETRTKNFEDFNITLNYNSRIGNSTSDHLVFSIKIKNKGPNQLKIKRINLGDDAHEGDIAIGGGILDTQSCSILDNMDKPMKDICYVYSNFSETVPPYGSVIWTGEIRGTKNKSFEIVKNEILRIFKRIDKKNEIIGNIYSVLFYSSNWEEKCNTQLPIKTLESGSRESVANYGVCCDNKFFISTLYCSRKEQIKKEAENVILHSGYPEKTNFSYASVMLQNKLNQINQSFLYKGRPIFLSEKRAMGKYNYAVLFTKINSHYSEILERASNWIARESAKYSKENNFSINFTGINEQINTSGINSSDLSEVGRQILLKYKEKNLDLDAYDGFMVLVDYSLLQPWDDSNPDFVNVGGVANTVVQINGKSYIVNFVTDDGFVDEKDYTSFVHELLHNFGATDIKGGNSDYYFDNFVFYPCLMGERSPGTSIEMVNLCNISAAEIGWLDLNENGQADVFEWN